MAGKQSFSQTINYKGQFDVSDIIKGLQQIRQQLGNSTKNQSLFIDVDKELKKVNDLSKQIQAAIQKGFSNPQELKNFEKITSQLEKSLNRVSSSLQDVDLSIINQSAKELKIEFDKQKNTLKSVIDEQKRFIEEQFKGITGAKTYTKQIIDAAKSGKDLKDIQESITKELESQTTMQKEKVNLAKQNVNKAEADLKKAEDVLEETKGRNRLSLRRNSFANITSVNDKGEMDNISAEQMTKVKQKYTEILSEMNSIDDAEAATEKLEKFLDNLNIKIKHTDTLTKNFAQNFQELSKEVELAEKNLSNAEKNLSNAEKNFNKANTALTNAEDKAQSNQKIVNAVLGSDELADSYGKIAQQTKKAAKAKNDYNIASNQTSRYTTELQRQNSLITQQFNNIKKNTEATNETAEATKKISNRFDDLKNSVKTFLSIGSAIAGVRNVVRNTFNDIQALDKSFADIAMVTDYSVSQMWESYGQYAEMANELGQSTQSVIQASGLFYQQGLDTVESLNLTRDTMKLATLANLDFEKATSQMTAALRGFHMEMNEGNRVTDVYSELAAKAAADVQGIAYAMSKTASIASSAGMEFETTSAFLTQMIETTQEAPKQKPIV